MPQTMYTSNRTHMNSNYQMVCCVPGCSKILTINCCCLPDDPQEAIQMLNVIGRQDLMVLPFDEIRKLCMCLSHFEFPGNPCQTDDDDFSEAYETSVTYGVEDDTSITCNAYDETNQVNQQYGYMQENVGNNTSYYDVNQFYDDNSNINISQRHTYEMYKQNYKPINGQHFPYGQMNCQSNNVPTRDTNYNVQYISNQGNYQNHVANGNQIYLNAGINQNQYMNNFASNVQNFDNHSGQFYQQQPHEQGMPFFINNNTQVQYPSGPIHSIKPLPQNIPQNVYPHFVSNMPPMNQSVMRVPEGKSNIYLHSNKFSNGFDNFRNPMSEFEEQFSCNRCNKTFLSKYYVKNAHRKHCKKF